MNRRDALKLAGLALALPAASVVQANEPFQIIEPAQKADDPSKIEVLEFFHYGCPHCRDLEPYLTEWAAKAPSDVSFKKIPVVFQPAWLNLGKIYYTLEGLGREDLSPKVFQALHGAGIKLWDDKTFFDWAVSNGLDAKKVQEMWASFAVNSKMNRAKTLAANYRVDSTPVLFVDGKFMVQSGALKDSHKGMPAALDFLVAKARSERSKK